jgi:hypothetical protein
MPGYNVVKYTPDTITLNLYKAIWDFLVMAARVQNF